MLKKNEIEIFPGIKIIDSYRAIYLERLRLLAISDLQLGEELYLAEQGILVPQVQLKEILKSFKGIFRMVKPKGVVINGDVKHEFGEASSQEWREVKELTNYLRKKVEEVILVRGNHDNYLLTIANQLGLKVHDPYYLVDGILFTHGHKKIELPKEAKTVVIGHEQPAILLVQGYDRIKVPCLLYGKMKDGRNFICLPAFSPLASGVAINLVGNEELLSPILREEVDKEDLIPIALDEETGALKFPKIKFLKQEI
ncbi:MAG: metallophosphoesterase [Candidatus Aenigmatarchaeota archaeon]